MGQRLIISENERSQIAKMYGLVNEQSSSAKQVAGPFSKSEKDLVKYYIFQDGSKFYIYMTNASQKEPTLFKGSLWDNKGQGYPNQMEANKVIDDLITRGSMHPGIKLEPKKMGMEEQSDAPQNSPAPKPPKPQQPSVKLQVYDDKELVMLIEIDRTSVKHNNLKSEFNYKVRGGSGEYTGYFNTRKPNKVELDRCQLFNDRVIKRDYTEFAVAGCPEDSWHEFNLSPEGSRVMDKLFGKEGRYASNDSGEDMSNMA